MPCPLTGGGAYEEVAPNGRSEVYVRPLRASRLGGRIAVSAGGGSQPRWTRGGRELVYRDGHAMMAVSFQPTTGVAGTPVLLFRKADAGSLGSGRTIGYDVTPDGSRFLLAIPIESPEAQPVVVVLNWFAELRQRMR